MKILANIGYFVGAAMIGYAISANQDDPHHLALVFSVGIALLVRSAGWLIVNWADRE